MLYEEGALLPRPILFEYYHEIPTVKQHTALILRHIKEIFYGGAAGGGWYIRRVRASGFFKTLFST